MSSSKKLDLTYPNFEEFIKCSNFDFSALDFNKPTICNSLLKLYDQGTKHLKNGDEEKAYMLLLRFFEGVLKLRNSKMYKQDKSYVENFISMEKLNQTIIVLERLRDDLKLRYEQRDKTKNPTGQQEGSMSEIDKISINFEKINLNSIEKKFINPKELTEIINKSIFKLLLIDIRSKNEFDYSHMDLNILLTEEIKKSSLSHA